MAKVQAMFRYGFRRRRLSILSLNEESFRRAFANDLP
jgi:hypothetical protein